MSWERRGAEEEFLNLRLQSTSPAIDAGANLTQAGTVDIDGQARTQCPAIDRGVDEVR